MQLFPRRLGDDLDPAVERIVLVEQRQIRAPAAEQLGKHFTKIRANLFKRVGKEFPCSGIDARDDVEQLAPRIREIGVLRFVTFVTLLEFIELVDSIQIYGTHVVELGSKFSNNFFQIWRGQLRGARRRGSSALQFFRALYLCPQRLFERCLVWCKLAKINMIAARDMRDDIIDVHLQLRLAHLPLSAAFLQFA